MVILKVLCFIVNFFFKAAAEEFSDFFIQINIFAQADLNFT